MSKAPKETNKDPVTGKPLPKGVWYRGPGQYQARKMVDGKRHRETFATASLARRWLMDVRAKAHVGQLEPPASQRNQITFRELFERYGRERMADRDADRRGHLPSLLASRIADLKIGKWTNGDVRVFRDTMLTDGLAKGTVVKRLNLIAAIVEYANSEWDTDIVNHASAKRTKRPEGADRKRNRRLHDGEEELLLQAAADPNGVFRHHSDVVWLIRWSIEQGCRLSESISLRWNDINFARQTISLARVKNDRHRDELGPEIRPMTKGAQRVLTAKLDAMETKPDGDQHIFSVGERKVFSVLFGRMTRQAGVTDMTFHDLRHEATSRLARYLNPIELTRVTGHRDLKSLSRYYQPVPADIANKTK
ncbi:site-specific integrase [Gluconacetobacter aggeris]|uniref:Site-specific integrase n=1 Tax=Gluconacetobacter aggeris TaxID=1286186 RepID=A0A7W4IWM2_9PROT|nr:site-specific integrase [Gluconacetobacter aggeris]MBB2170373.1 site-specific integrase [Gluconacetobacter aggeris]